MATAGSTAVARIHEEWRVGDLLSEEGSITRARMHLAICGGAETHDVRGDKRRRARRPRILKAGLIAFNGRHSTLPCAVREISAIACEHYSGLSVLQLGAHRIPSPARVAPGQACHIAPQVTESTDSDTMQENPSSLRRAQQSVSMLSRGSKRRRSLTWRCAIRAKPRYVLLEPTTSWGNLK